MKLIVGLGNPGEKYAGVRHNLGFTVVDEYAKKCLPSTDYSKFWKYENKFKAEVGRLNSEDILLAEPQTYMNNSGMAVKLLASYYKIAPEDIIIIHDELDLPLGKIKVRLGGAGAGHHGVESIIAALGTDQFIRVRLGIGNLRTLSGEHKGRSISVEKFVLEPFTRPESGPVRHMIKQATKALDLILKKGLEKAQNQYN
ncbi:aminoacyl-tRNA hydrolase [Candidatus Daviesbacteria bacterium RIFCSPHIGHO2_01_FULL_40_11]|uniref:Peptidyl-tRNA hydrolase n=1 Tax=Candidatus Daviesbacteria bacterium RIFCSPHIGHO2_01_FULL_40_11 TaxID=1797762 RepID=A0A1F5JGR4_9BACT|nr:MAG: aminoacyl-tRNA hydrolase [Candidatus Daviesbacteria bacterium RIFCSPHIGHO2_01_FULL_40_11]